jgi:hypothetical protein
LENFAQPDEEGWITLNVADLLFPPWCCDCGAPTLCLQPFRVHHTTGFALIRVPVCETCQNAFRQKYRRAFWKPFLLVLFVVAIFGFALGTVPSLTGRDPKSFPILPILCALGAAMVSFPLVWIVIRRRALRVAPPPVQFRRYVRNMNATFRFRRPEYATDVVTFLEAAARSTK